MLNMAFCQINFFGLRYIKSLDSVENLVHMAIFARVVETLSFTEAAQALGMSKSSVSRAVSVLENKIGSRLLKRTTRKIEITELGLSYYQHCFKIVNELNSSQQFIRNYYQEPTGTISILAPVTFGTTHVVPILSTFLEKNIHANIELDLSDKEVDIKNSSYDLVIEVSRGTPIHEYVRFLCSISWGLYATPGYLRSIKAIHTPTDLPSRDFILFCGVARTTSLSFRKDKQKVNINVQSRFRSNNSIALINMALSGCGIAYLPTYAVREHVRSGKLERVLTGWEMEEFKIWLLSKKKSTLNSSVKHFSDELQQRITAAEEPVTYFV